MIIKDNKIYEIAYHIIDYKNVEAQDAAAHILFTYKDNDDIKYIIFNCKDCYVYVIPEFELIDVELYKKCKKLADVLLDKELYLLLMLNNTYKHINSYKLINFRTEFRTIYNK